jgi:hypothetical protein
MSRFTYDNSDSDSDDESSYLGAQITEIPVKEQIVRAKQSIINLAQGLDLPQILSLKPEDIDSRIEVIRQEQNIQFDPNDTELNNLNKLRENLLQKTRNKGGKRRKSKKYRKSRKQRKTKTKTKRRVRRSYKYKYK